MSRTTRCLFALGLCASLAAACGDDDGDDDNTGGTGGTAGSAGTAGRGGTGGTGGTAGRGGTGGGGTGGVAGTAGGGTGGGGTGGTAGTAGTAGTGGDDTPDAGPDADVVSDAGADSGVNGNCPDFATEAADIEGAFNQSIVISRVEFVNEGARVTFRGVGAGDFDFSFNSVCVSEAVPDDCGEFEPGFDADEPFEVDEELFVFVPDLSPAGGELAVTNNDPEAAIVFAYIAWGEASGSPLEDLAASGGFWTLGEFVEVDENNTIYGNGDATSADGYGVCTGDGDTLSD